VTSDEATIAVVEALEALKIPYMVVGSFSTNFYGVPRSTHDVDLIVQLGSGKISALADHLGSPFELDPQMSSEAVTGSSRFVLHLADTPFSVELFLLGDDAHDRERFARRRRERLENRDVYLPTVEDAIITKLRWSYIAGRRKDLDDVKNVLAVQGDAIDWTYVYSWCDQHGTRQLLDGIREELRRDLP
jgi:hypothetical protein